MMLGGRVLKNLSKMKLLLFVSQYDRNYLKKKKMKSNPSFKIILKLTFKILKHHS